MSNDMLRMLIGWAPTILFAVAILIGIVIGIVRGFRKSMILFIHMLVIGGICLGFYIWLFNQKNTDEMLVKCTNQVLGWFNLNLQDMIGVSKDAITMQDIILEKILSTMSSDQLIATVVISENAMYIATLVEMVYRIILFILVALIYYILVFIMYIIYLTCYPVRRKIKKYNARFTEGEKTHLYKRRRIVGAVIGGFRACISSVIGLSFLGAIVFIASGGVETPQRDEFIEGEGAISFGDESYNQIYDYYSYVCEMGDTGIFKVLNAMKDPKNTPYYFYIADLVLQGGITDENQGIINQTFYFRDETGSYVGFCKKVINAILAHGGSNIVDVLSSGTNDEKMNVLFDIMSSPGFSEELNKIIDEFEAKTYFVNLALSALTSIVNHVDLLKLDPSITGLIKCIFTGENSIKVTDLATEDDVKTLFKAVINVIATETPEGGISTTQPLAKTIIPYAKGLIPEFQKLSFFTDENRRGKANKLFGKVYTYCASEFVDEGTELPEIPANMDWINELDVLLSASDPLLSIANEVYSDDSNVMIENLLTMFEGENSDYMKTQYDSFVDNFLNSYLLDVVFKSSIVGKALDDMVQNVLSNEEITIPHNLQFSNQKDENGNIIYGECYYILRSVRYLLENDIYTVYTNFTNEGITDTEKYNSLLTILGTEIEEDSSKELLVNKVLNSNLVYYLVSTMITNFDFGIDLYVSEDIKHIVTEGDKSFEMVSKSEIKLLVSSILNCKDTLLTVLEDPQNIDYSVVLADENLYIAVEDSMLLQCVLSSAVVGNLSSLDSVALPVGFDKAESWIDSKDSSGAKVKGELSHLIQGVKAVSKTEDFDINALLKGEININLLNNLEQATIDSLLNSKVLLYTISDTLSSIGTDSFKIVVPYASIEEIGYTTKNKEVKIVKREELSSVISSVLKFATFNDSTVIINYKKLFDDKDNLLQNLVIQATVIDLLISMADEEGAILAVPTAYRTDAAKLETELPANNIWFGQNDSVTDDEIYKLFSLLEQLLGDISDDFDISKDLESSLRFKESDAASLSSSAVLNSTIAKNLITNDIACPVTIYENELIDNSELQTLFTGLVNIFGSTEEGQTEKSLTLETIQSIDINSFVLDKADVDLLLSSEILTNKLSSYILDVSQIKIPLSVTEAVDVVNQTGTISTAKLRSGADSEFNILMDCLFDLFGKTEDGKTVIDVSSLTNIDFETLSISQDATTNLLNSQILSATLTSQITNIEELVIPMDVLGEAQDFYNQEEKGYITNRVELKNVLDSLFALFGIKINDDTTISIANIDVNTLRIRKSDVSLILSSRILAATVSSKIIDVQELTIPTSTLDMDVAAYGGKTSNIIHCGTSASELNVLFNALFPIIGVDDPDLNEKVIDAANLDVTNLVIQQENVDDLLASEIIVATISKNVLEQNDLVIPADTLDLNVEVYRSSNSTNQNTTASIIKSGNAQEMEKLLDALFELLGGANKEINVESIDLTTLSIKESQINTLLNSAIITATISDKITDQNELLVPVAVVDPSVIVYRNNVEGSSAVIQSGSADAELNKLFDALFQLLGTKSSASDELSLDITNMQLTDLAIGKSQLDMLLSSSIIASTLSDKVFDQAELIIPTSILNMNIEIYNKATPNIYTTAAVIQNGTGQEMRKLLDALFILFEDANEEIKIDSINLDSLKIKESQVDSLLQSTIITATISDKITDQSDLIIPLEVVDPTVEVFKNNTLGYNAVIQSGTNEELNKLFNALFQLVGVEDSASGELSLDVTNMELTNLCLKKSSFSTLLESTILASTISNKIFEQSELIIPTGILNSNVELYNKTAPETTTLTSLIQSGTGEEMYKLFDGLFAVFADANDQIVINEINLEQFDVKKSQINILLESSIITATISEKVLKQDDVIAPLSTVDLSVEVYQRTSGVSSTSPVILSGTGEEMHKLFDGLFALMGQPIAGTDDLKLNVTNLQMSDLVLKSNQMAVLLQSEIISATISEQVLAVDSLVVPRSTIQYTGVYSLASSMNKYIFNYEDGELNKLFTALFEFLGTKDGDTYSLRISDVDLSSISMKKSVMSKMLASEVLAATISKEIMDLQSLDIPVDVLLQCDIYTPQGSVLEQNNINITELEALTQALFTMFGRTDAATGDMILDVNAAGINVNSLSINSNKLASCLLSEIMSSTISAQILKVTALQAPSNIKQMVSFYDYIAQSSVSKAKIDNAEIKALVEGLLITAGNEIAINSITLNSIQLPANQDAATNMLQSLIIAATFSDKIMDSTELIPDSYRTKYSFNSVISDETYIEQSELASLILSISNGLGFSDVANLDFTTIQVPDTEDKKSALLGSIIMRTIISDKVLDNAGVEADCLDAYEIMAISGVDSIILSSKELSAVISGILLISGTNGSFTDLDLDINTIMTLDNKDGIIDAIANSSIYRNIMSASLNRNAVATYSIYQLLWKQEAVTIDYTWASTTFTALGEKLHIQASTEKQVLNKTTSGYETVLIQLFTQEDFQALKYCNPMTGI